MNIKKIIETAVIAEVLPVYVMIGYEPDFTDSYTPGLDDTNIFYRHEEDDEILTGAELYTLLIDIYKGHIKHQSDHADILPREIYHFFSQDSDHFSPVINSVDCIETLKNESINGNVILIDEASCTRVYPDPELIGVWRSEDRRELLGIQPQLPEFEFKIFEVHLEDGKVAYNENT